jgi:hypothetical protein
LDEEVLVVKAVSGINRKKSLKVKELAENLNFKLQCGRPG